MTIVTQPPGTPPTPEEKALQDILCNCHNSTPRAPNESCKDLGIRKHDCCEAAIQAHKPPPEIGGEQGYNRRSGKALTQTRAQAEAAGKLKGTAWPDACAMSGGQPTQFFDFKFPCGGEADADFYFPAGRSQYDKYKSLSKKRKMPGDPKVITSRAC